MKKLYIVSAVLFCILSVCTCKKDEKKVPSLTTTSVSDISPTTAKSGGNVVDDGGAAVAAFGICWAMTANPTIDGLKTVASGTGAYTSQMTLLEPNTQYYVRAYATNSVGTGYGTQVTFTTLPPAVPSLTTTDITDKTERSAVSGGSVTFDNGEIVTERGVCWSTNPNPTVDDSKIPSGDGTGSFVCNLTGLTPFTTYYVRAYAINSIGTGYGDQKITVTNDVADNLKSGLIGYYPFNGNANDGSGNGNNGTVNGAALTTDVFGHPNCAYYFNGESANISLKPAASFVGLNTYSIALWVKPTTYDTNGGGMIYGIGSTTLGAVQGLTYQPTNNLFAGTYNFGGTPAQSYSKTCCFLPNVWVYVVVTRDLTSINLYINGSLVTPQDTSPTGGYNADYGPGPYAAILGGRSSLDYKYFFTGVIDEVRIYNRVLSADEITAIKALNQ